MVKYKLIKIYPGSPKLGTIEEVEHCFKNLMMGSNGKYLYNISESPEFWELVVEKDYEIISYIHNGSKHIWKKDSQLKDTFCIEDGKSPFTRLEDILKYPKIYSIYSIKRKSDDEIFAIGDKVVGYNNSIAKIKTIDLVGEISLNIGTDKHEGFSLKNLKKLKQPLFTTEDGVDIYEGDNVHFVCDEYNYHYVKNVNYTYCGLINGVKKGVYKIFPTKEKAEEYILMNKPVLSLSDVWDNLKTKDQKEVLKFVKSKLNK